MSVPGDITSARLSLSPKESRWLIELRTVVSEDQLADAESRIRGVAASLEPYVHWSFAAKDKFPYSLDYITNA